jgi:hypothetical protein
MAKTKIEGAKGTWDVDITDNAPPLEDKIKISFTPKKNPTGCKNIRLVQTVQVEAFNEKGDKVGKKAADIYVDQKDNPFKHRADDEIVDGDGNVFAIDHLSCEKDPFYNGDDLQDSKSQGDATTDPPTPTELDDNPRISFGPDKKADIVKVVQTFQTCAICVDTGEILGCVCWKSESTRNPENKGQITLSSGTKECAVSQALKDALKKFMENHTAKKEGDPKIRYYCPDDKTFGEPVPEGMLKIIAKVDAPVKSGTIKPMFMTKDILIRRMAIGSAQRMPSMADSLKHVIESPGSSAFKFTWTGDQIKTIPSFLLSPVELRESVIASILENRPEMSNDFASLKFSLASPGFITIMAQYLLEKNSILDADQIKPVMITVAAQLNQKVPVFASAGMTPSDFLQFLIAISLAADEQLSGIINFLRLNMGLDNSGTIGTNQPTR